MDSASPWSDPYAPILRAAAGSILRAHGIEKCEWGVAARLGDALANFLRECGARSKAICEHANRTEILPTDISLALIESGINVSALRDYVLDGSARQVRPVVATDEAARSGSSSRHEKVNVRVTQVHYNALRQSEKQSHFAVRDASNGASQVHTRPAHIPDYLPAFPAVHTYVHTAARREPDAVDLATRAEQIAVQRIAMQRALIRLVAHKTHRRRTVYRFAFPGDEHDAHPTAVSDTTMSSEDVGPKQSRVKDLFDDPNGMFVLGDEFSERSAPRRSAFQRTLDALTCVELGGSARQHRTAFPDASAFLMVEMEKDPSATEHEVGAQGVVAGGTLAQLGSIGAPGSARFANLSASQSLSGRLLGQPIAALANSQTTPFAGSKAGGIAAGRATPKAALGSGSAPKRVSNYSVSSAAGEGGATPAKRPGPGRPPNSTKFTVQRPSHAQTGVTATPVPKKS